MDKDPPSASPYRPTPERQELETRGPSARRGPVLLVEDNGTDVLVIRQVLQQCGLAGDLRVASDGQDALRYLQDLESTSAAGPELILLDLNVPRIPGIDVLRRLRAGRWRSTPVIIVTSSHSPEDRMAAEKLGAEAYFQKPNDLEAYLQLAEVIKRIVRGRRKP
ncbi:MAG TPA: response regulator [Bryobacteraceae bacterium]|nr:response regulator [Bryobacteraceae bacterium]